MFLFSKVYGQTAKIPEDFGFRSLKIKYQDDPVDLLILSKKGEERIAKPLFFCCPDNLPKPLICYGEKGMSPIFSFEENLICEHFHLVIPSNPFIPVIFSETNLGENNFFYKNPETKQAPKGFCERNYLEYYVFRNNFILKQLAKERWVKCKQIVVVGFGNGANVAVKMASLHKKITHLVYSQGNPFGMISTNMIEKQENDFEYFLQNWKNVIEKPQANYCSQPLSNKSIYSFSLPQNDNLLQLDIPVFFDYGKNTTTTFNDLFQLEAIRQRKTQFVFNRNIESEKCPISYSEKILNWLQT